MPVSKKMLASFIYYKSVQYCVHDTYIELGLHAGKASLIKVNTCLARWRYW